MVSKVMENIFSVNKNYLFSLLRFFEISKFLAIGHIHTCILLHTFNSLKNSSNHKKDTELRGN